MHLTNNLRLLVPIIAIALSSIAHPATADILGFGDFTGFTVNQGDSDSAPALSIGSIKLTGLGSEEDRSVFYNTPQDIAKFAATFTYQAIGDVTGSPGGGFGTTFVIQNDAEGVNAVHSFLGYNGFGTGIRHSAAISLEVGTQSATSSVSGFYTNGNVSAGAPPTSPVNLFSGDPINVSLIYNGTTISETLVDSVTTASYTALYAANIPSLVGGSNALVGFGASAFAADQQIIFNFHFSSVPEPSSALLLGLGAMTSILYACRYGIARPFARN